MNDDQNKKQDQTNADDAGLTTEQIEEDTKMAPVPEDVSQTNEEPAEKPSENLTEEQIKEDQQMASIEGAKQPAEEVKEAPVSLSPEQIKEDSTMAPVEDPDERLEEAKKVLNKVDPNDPADLHTTMGPSRRFCGLSRIRSGVRPPACVESGAAEPDRCSEI